MNLIHIGIIVTAIISTLLILLQERGDGAGSIFGGGGGEGAYQNRRGVEKFMFIGTIVFVAAFAAFCILNLAYPDKTVNTLPPSTSPATVVPTPTPAPVNP